jgi:pimeloyl-ACP methyl ester carboxylesterase
VLTIAGAQNSGDLVEATLRLVADDVTGVVLPDTGHYPAEESPEAMLAGIRDFLAARGEAGSHRPNGEEHRHIDA